MFLFWNNLEENIKHLEKMPLKMHFTKHKAKCNPYYCLGNQQFNIIMTRLRMRCSELRQHLFDMNIIENKNCECGLPETTSHFVPRRILCDFFLRNNFEFTVHVLLYGISDGIISDVMVYHTTLFTCQATIIFIFSLQEKPRFHFHP